ncbi:MAG TPA: hypothetical protein VIE16_08560 [Phenylobacterium sp.]|jgi:hypothetical protein
MLKSTLLAATAAFLLAGVAHSAGPATCRDSKGHFTACPAAGATVAQAGAYSLDAKGNCHDAKGKMAKKSMCAAPAASVTGTPASATTTAMSAAGGPKCVKGKRCGNACISLKDVCHK